MDLFKVDTQETLGWLIGEGWLTTLVNTSKLVCPKTQDQHREGPTCPGSRRGQLRLRPLSPGPQQSSTRDSGSEVL